MRRNPTNKCVQATPEICSQIEELREAMATAARTRKHVMDFMTGAEASFVVSENGEVLAQLVTTNSGNVRLELMDAAEAVKA
jgi:hypothetical protein